MLKMTHRHRAWNSVTMLTTQHNTTMSAANRAISQGSLEIKPSQSDLKRFSDKVDKSNGEDSCWNWKAGVDYDGYGKFWFLDDTIRAHRFAWFVVNGAIPSDTPFVCHTCDNPSCVNPSHLFIGSSDDNILDMMIKDRHLKGEDNGGARLTNAQVIQIRELHATGVTTSRKLGRQFNVGKSTILRILSGKCWAHLLPQHHSHF